MIKIGVLPQAALSAFTKCICHRWTFIQRTMPNISHLFAPLEQCLRDIFIPSLVGRPVSDIERKILSLPIRFGGLGIADPVENSNREYNASKAVTASLSNLIQQQIQDLALYDRGATVDIIKNLKKEKESFLNQKFDQVIHSIENECLKRCLQLNKEKRAGCWLTALPLKDHSFCLNKQEFRDAICLRYGWRIPNTPHYCGCGAKNNVGSYPDLCKRWVCINEAQCSP